MEKNTILLVERPNSIVLYYYIVQDLFEFLEFRRRGPKDVVLGSGEIAKIF